MSADDIEEQKMRSAALQNSQRVLEARQRADDELLQTKQALERKSVELSESVAMLRATLDSTTDGILVTTPEGRISAYNRRFVEMWNLADELPGRSDHHTLIREVAHRNFADAAMVTARINQIYESSEAESYDILETLDHRTVERFSRSNQNAGRVWTFRDITAQKTFEEALRDETRILDLLNKTGISLAGQLDLHSVVQSVTDSATQLSGANFGAFFYNVINSRGETYLLYTLSGAPIEKFAHFGVPRNTPLFAATFHGQGVIRIDDVTNDPRYGQMSPHHGMPPGHLPVRSYLAVPVISRSGEVIGGLFFGHRDIGIFTERTERLISGVAAQAAVAIDNARLYEQAKHLANERETLLKAERAARSEAERVSLQKDEFLANVSHELRTPLNAILGWSQLIAAGRLGTEDMKQGLETIARNARLQAQLIEDLLDMNRIVSGKVRLDVQQVDFSVIVEQAFSTVQPSAEAKGIRLRKIVDPRIGLVMGDPNRLQQVVWNLLSNAVKFTPRGGKVEVVAQRISSHLEVTVTDSGAGIRPEFLPHVFERFRQADSSVTRSHGGLGLGLSIVRQLVELHGGTVRAESPGEGQGATFVVCLPLSAVCKEDREHPRALTRNVLGWESIDLSGVRILVVEDESDARELIKRVLEQHRAEVITAGSAIEAMELLRARKFDLLISDIGMPGMDGYQFIRKVRELPRGEGGAVPAVALTAFARSEDRTRAMIAGYQMHIAKPIEPQELIATAASFSGRTTQNRHES